MRRLVAVFVSLFLAFNALVVASPALAVDGEAKDVFAARVIAKSTNNRVLVTGLLDEFSTTFVNPGFLTLTTIGAENSLSPTNQTQPPLTQQVGPTLQPGFPGQGKWLR